MAAYRPMLWGLPRSSCELAICLHVRSEFESTVSDGSEARHDLISDLSLDLAASCLLMMACKPKSESEARINCINLTERSKNRYLMMESIGGNIYAACLVIKVCL